MAGPLEGVRILDCTEIIAAPYACALLSDMGADVLKVEPVGGEAWRLQNQFRPLESRSFMALNRGKRALAVNLRDARGQEIIHGLVRRSDVMVLNYRPDTPARLGIDYETVSALNPRLVYVWNTAFGRDGPHANRPGYDIIIQAYSGLMATLGGQRNGLPTTMPMALADIASALVVAWAVTSGLYARERTGEGQLIDTSLLGTAIALQPNRYFAIEELDRERMEEVRESVREARREATTYEELHARVTEARMRREIPPETRGNIYYRTYQCRDGYVAVGCLSAALRAKFCGALGIEDPRYTGDPEYARGSPKFREVGLRLAAEVEAKFAQRTVEEWLAYLDARGVPSGPLMFPEELWDDPQVRENGLIAQVEHPVVGKITTYGPPIRMSKTPLRPRSASPVLGADTDAVLSELGYTPDQAEALRRAGVVG
jgi:formyl-CoA transferase